MLIPINGLSSLEGNFTLFSFSLMINDIQNLLQGSATKPFSNISKFVIIPKTSKNFQKPPKEVPYVIFTYYTSLTLSQNQLWETA